MAQTKGWKTLTGAIIYALAKSFSAMSAYEAFSAVYPEVAMYFAVAGIGLEAIGGPLAVIGLGHKFMKAEIGKIVS